MKSNLGNKLTPPQKEVKTLNLNEVRQLIRKIIKEEIKMERPSPLPKGVVSTNARGEKLTIDLFSDENRKFIRNVTGIIDHIQNGDNEFTIIGRTLNGDSFMLTDTSDGIRISDFQIIYFPGTSENYLCRYDYI